MDIEYFNRKIVAAEEKLFDAEIIITGCVFDIVKSYNGSSVIIYVEMPVLGEEGYASFYAERIFLAEDTGVISLSDGKGKVLSWDEIDITAKENTLNELYHKYCSDKLYDSFSAGEEIH